MLIITILLVVYATLGAAYWIMTAYGAVRLRRDVPSLNDPGAEEPRRWPKLSVVVPACNEADKLEDAFRTLMAQDYPTLELILVDDRSTDGTGEIADRLGALDARVSVVHIDTLPEGWLGKVHALDQGYAQSTGELVLFTDADVHFAPGALRKSAAYCEREILDHLTLVPHLQSAGLVTDAIVASFLRPFMVLLARPWKVSDPKSGAFAGIGAFNMVRREAFERTEKFEWLRMEVGDDMALGLLMKRSGARCAVVTAFDEVALTWHRSAREALRASEKAYAPACRFSITRSVASAILMLGMELSPLVLLAGFCWAALRVFGAVGVGLLAVEVITTAGIARWAHGRVLPSVLSPIASIIGAFALVRAAVLGRRRDGIVWRGTRYSTETLRRGMRLSLGMSGTAREESKP